MVMTMMSVMMSVMMLVMMMTISSKQPGFSGIICPWQAQEEFHHSPYIVFIISLVSSSLLQSMDSHYSLKVRQKMPLLFFFLWMHFDFETLSSITAVALKYVLYCWACPKRIDRQGRNSQMILKHIPLSSPISFSKHSLHIWQVSLLKIVKVLAEEKLIRNKIFLSWI